MPSALYALASDRLIAVVRRWVQDSDPDGWRTGTFNAPMSTLRLGRRYVEQLRDARSRALLEWEWTGDYAITERAAENERIVFGGVGREFVQRRR